MENVQRRAVRFIAVLKGRESVSEAREILGLEVLELRKKNLRMALMLKILLKEILSTLIGSFEFLHDGMHQYEKRQD